MGKKKSRIFKKKKKSVFSRPHPMRRKIMLKHRRMKAFLHKHNPRPKIERGIRKMVGRVYDVSDKVRDKIAEIKTNRQEQKALREAAAEEDD